MSNWIFRAVRVAIVALLAACLSALVLADEGEYNRLMAAAEAAKEADPGRADSLYRAAVETAERDVGPNHQAVAAALNELAVLLFRQGRYGDAEPIFQRSATIKERVFGSASKELALALNNLGLLLKEAGRYAEAEPILRRSLAIWEAALGSRHIDVGLCINNLALVIQGLGRYEEAEILFKRSVSIHETVRGTQSPETATLLNNLADLYSAMGRYADAERLLKQSLETREKTLGQLHPEVAHSLNNLATVMLSEGRTAEAAMLSRRAITIMETSLGPEHPALASALNNLGVVLQNQDQLTEAETLLRRSLTIREKTLGAASPALAQSLANLGALFAVQRRYREAEPLLQRSLTGNEKALGAEHPDLGHVLELLGVTLRELGRPGEAEQAHRRSLAIRGKTLGSGHPLVAASLDNLSWALWRQGRLSDALAAIRQANAIVAGRLGEDSASSQRRGIQALALKKHRDRFLYQASLLDQINREAGKGDGWQEEGFIAGQYATLSDTGGALAGMAIRSAGGKGPLADLVRRHQDAQSARSAADRQLLAAVSRPPEQRGARQEAALRSVLAEAEQSEAAAVAELKRQFPRYLELAAPAPLTLAEAKRLLDPGEALLLYAFGAKEAFGWLVTGGGIVGRRLDSGGEELARAVGTLRRPGETTGQTGAVAPFADAEVKAAHDLYRRLVEPFEPSLKHVRHLIVVPDGPLVSLPLAMLVSEAPKAPVKDAGDLARLPWLIKRFAISVLPEAGSLRALRQYGRASQAAEPFAGFGDPEFAGSRASMRALRSADLLGSTLADPQVLRRALQPLPESRGEILALADAIQAPATHLYFGQGASERRVKEMDLSRFRFLAFGTHGIMAAELKGLVEPALALTPPESASPLDDGLLKASEIAQLKLDADLAILSACNTAAPDGTPGAAGFSGLAKAFFHAGARSLLVTSWSVESESAALLTTAMMRRYRAAPAEGRAQAMRTAMLALMSDARHPEYAHPFFWAPFLVVGEGR